MPDGQVPLADGSPVQGLDVAQAEPGVACEQECPLQFGMGAFGVLQPGDLVSRQEHLVGFLPADGHIFRRIPLQYAILDSMIQTGLEFG